MEVTLFRKCRDQACRVTRCRRHSSLRSHEYQVLKCAASTLIVRAKVRTSIGQLRALLDERFEEGKKRCHPDILP